MRDRLIALANQLAGCLSCLFSQLPRGGVFSAARAIGAAVGAGRGKGELYQACNADHVGKDVGAVLKVRDGRIARLRDFFGARQWIDNADG